MKFFKRVFNFLTLTYFQTLEFSIHDRHSLTKIEEKLLTKCNQNVTFFKSTKSSEFHGEERNKTGLKRTVNKKEIYE